MCLIYTFCDVCSFFNGVDTQTLGDLVSHQKVSLHLYNERFHNGSAEIFAQLLKNGNLPLFSSSKITAIVHATPTKA